MNPKRPRRPRSTVPFGLVLLALSGFAAGCGGSSSGGGHGDADNFVGRWEIDPDSGAYTFAECETAGGNGDFIIWSELAFDYGELTDINEMSGGCITVVSSQNGSSTIPGLPYDVSGDTASLPTTDPYTLMPSSCIAAIGSDSYGYPIGMRLTPVKETWQFKLQPSASGEPRRAELGVKPGGAGAAVDIISVDQNNNLITLDSCKVTGASTFFRVSTE